MFLEFRRSRWAASAAASVVGLGLVVSAAGTAFASGPAAATPVTRAALDPALVAGGGATVRFVE